MGSDHDLIMLSEIRPNRVISDPNRIGFSVPTGYLFYSISLISAVYFKLTMSNKSLCILNGLLHLVGVKAQRNTAPG